MKAAATDAKCEAKPYYEEQGKVVQQGPGEAVPRSQAVAEKPVICHLIIGLPQDCAQNMTEVAAKVEPESEPRLPTLSLRSCDHSLINYLVLLLLLHVSSNISTEYLSQSIFAIGSDASITCKKSRSTQN